MEKIKILCCSHTDHLGGAELALLEVVDSLSDTMEIFIMLPDTNGKLPSMFSKCGSVHLIKHSFVWWMRSQYNVKRRIKDAMLIMNDIKTCNQIIKDVQPNIMLVNSIACLTPLISAKNNHVPAISFVHEVDGFGLFHFLFGNKITKLIIKKSASHILFNSYYTANQYNFKNNNRTSVLYQPINIDMCKKHELHENEINVGVVGILSEQKNQLMIFQALKDVVRLHFLVAGNYDTEYGHYVKKYCEVSNIQNVEWLGVVNDMASYYTKIDVLVACGKQESLGRTVIEAMKCKIPVIALNEGGYRELIGENQRGLLFDTLDELHYYITKRVFINTERLQKAYDFAMKNFSMCHFQKQILTLVKTLSQ